MKLARLKISLIALAVTMFGAAHSALAGPADKECSCDNLESLQQELDNANHLRDTFSKMADQLRQQEKKWADAKKDPTHPDSGININASSQAMRKTLSEAIKLPYPAAKDYTGPERVDMKPGACEIEKSADAKGQMTVDTLEELRKGSQCKGIADAVVKHEQTHLQQCQATGAAAYWDRPGSAFAQEEAERYAQQAQDLREQLRRVIDDSSVIVEATLEPRISGPHFDVTYSYVTSPGELRGKSDPGQDTWTLNGKAVRTTTIKRAKIAGMSCSGSGALTHEVDFSLETDGKTMSLDSTETSKSGNVKVTCKRGFGMSKMPIGEMGGGPIYSGLPLKPETTYSENVADMDFGKMINQSGLSATGSHTVLVKLVCHPEAK